MSVCVSSGGVLLVCVCSLFIPLHVSLFVCLFVFCVAMTVNSVLFVRVCSCVVCYVLVWGVCFCFCVFDVLVCCFVCLRFVCVVCLCVFRMFGCCWFVCCSGVAPLHVVSFVRCEVAVENVTVFVCGL